VGATADGQAVNDRRTRIDDDEAADHADGSHGWRIEAGITRSAARDAKSRPGGA
jgi:hypothetical protein